MDLGKRERGKLKVAKMALPPWMREGRKGRWREKVSHRVRMSLVVLTSTGGLPRGVHIAWVSDTMAWSSARRFH